MLKHDDIRRLLQETDGQTLSLYLNVNPTLRENQARIPAWQIQLKNALKDIETRLDGDQEDAWSFIHNWIDDFFIDYQVASKGLVIFCSPAYQQVYELPIPTEHSYAYGEPLIAPLVWALEEYQRYLIVMVDQERADFISAYMGTADVETSVSLSLDTKDWAQKTLMPATSGRGSAAPREGSNRDAFDDRVDEHIARFYRDVVERIEELARDNGFTRIILGGTEQAARAVANLVPDHLKKCIVAVMAIPMRFSPHEVLEHVQPTALDYERRAERELVEQVIGLAKAGGRGVLGRREVVEAVEQQRAELLILPRDLEDEELKRHLPVKMLEYNGRLEIVHGEAAAQLLAEGGAAARLFYAIQPTT